MKPVWQQIFPLYPGMPVISFSRAVNPVQENRDPPWRKEVITALTQKLVEKVVSFKILIFNCFGAGIGLKKQRFSNSQMSLYYQMRLKII